MALPFAAIIRIKIRRQGSTSTVPTPGGDRFTSNAGFGQVKKLEWWRKSRQREHIIAVRLLDKFLENAARKGDSPDYKGRSAIEGVSRFETRCKVNEKPYQVKLVTRKAFNSPDKFRLFTLKDIELAKNKKAVSSG
jgi:hypothetical protein